MVREVNALSALLYAAAIRPSIKVIPKNPPSPDLNAISGNRRSVLGLLIIVLELIFYFLKLH